MSDSVYPVYTHRLAGWNIRLKRESKDRKGIMRSVINFTSIHQTNRLMHDADIYSVKHFDAQAHIQDKVFLGGFSMSVGLSLMAPVVVRQSLCTLNTRKKNYKILTTLFRPWEVAGERWKRLKTPNLKLQTIKPSIGFAIWKRNCRT